jgi:hypothetical protein
VTSTRAGEGTGLRDRGSVRVLGRDDVPAAVRVLSARPVENVFVAARVRAAGLDPATLGCQVWGFERDGGLAALCHAGSNLVPVNADDDALHAWTEYAGRQRMCASIIGPAQTATRFWRMLGDRWGSTWSDVRDVRLHQPVMTLVGDPLVAPDPRVRRVTLEHWDAYTEAAIKMYTEEIGRRPPRQPSRSSGSGSANHVRTTPPTTAGTP